MASLNKPITPDGLKVLHSLQNSEIGSCEHFEEHYPTVLPLDMYLTLEKRRKEKREEQLLEEQKQKEDKEKEGGEAA